MIGGVDEDKLMYGLFQMTIVDLIMVQLGQMNRNPKPKKS